MTRPSEVARIGWHGRTWYQEAADPLARFALAHDVPAGEAADILAIVSPRVSVRRSVSLASGYLGGPGDYSGLLPSTRAALAFYVETGTIRGPKTRAFARALRGDSSAVALDVWVLRALGLDRPPPRRLWPRVVGTVRALATRAGTSPAAYQAALWTGALILANRNPPNMADILREYTEC